jgi:hypothetical protein
MMIVAWHNIWCLHDTNRDTTGQVNMHYIDVFSFFIKGKVIVVEIKLLLQGNHHSGV